jgi:sirohydrochlorin ferrochelatase
MEILRTLVVALIAAVCAISVPAQELNAQTNSNKRKTGILLLAHGGKENWNDEVMKVAASIDRTMPVEVAFGMASKRSIQQAVDKLAAREVRNIVAVPLFISSHSSVITSTEYLLGQRKQAPTELAIFAKMDHGHGSHQSHKETGRSFDPLTPVESPVPIQMVSALGGHPLVADILASRAAGISSEPENEVVVVVAHGPVSDEANALWLSDMRLLVEAMRGKSSFKRIEYLTVRDDAPEPVRERAAEELRGVVKRALDEKSKVLIVPLLLAYGGIEEGIKKRLDGLAYTMSDQALLPDERLARWVLLSVENTVNDK